MAPRIILLLAALLAAGPVQSAPVRYVLDAQHSNISAKVAVFAISSMTAHFPDLRGEIQLSPDNLDAMHIDVTLNARALTTDDESWGDELKGKAFFDVETYPEVAFKGGKLAMTEDRTAQLSGQLTARGITRPVMLDVLFDKPPSQVDNVAPLTISASGQINRDDFGMTAYHGVVGRKVTIHIEATMQPS